MTANFDISLVIAWLIALVIGVIMVASASSAFDVAGISYGVRHVAYVLASICAFGVVVSLPLKLWEFGHKTCLFVALLLAVVVLIPGIGSVINGSRRWIDFGFFTFQASEWIKFLVLIYIAGFLSRSGEKVKRGGTELLRPMLWLTPVFLLVLIEPDFGTLVILLVLVAGLAFLAGLRLPHFLLAAVFVGGGLFLLILISPERTERLATFS